MGKTFKQRAHKLAHKIKKFKEKIKKPFVEEVFNLQYTDLKTDTNE